MHRCSRMSTRARGDRARRCVRRGRRRDRRARCEPAYRRHRTPQRRRGSAYHRQAVRGVDRDRDRVGAHRRGITVATDRRGRIGVGRDHRPRRALDRAGRCIAQLDHAIGERRRMDFDAGAARDELALRARGPAGQGAITARGDRRTIRGRIVEMFRAGAARQERCQPHQRPHARVKDQAPCRTARPTIRRVERATAPACLQTQRSDRSADRRRYRSSTPCRRASRPAR